MILVDRINAFVKLGEFLSQFSVDSIKKKANILHNDLFFEVYETQIKRAHETNGWFDVENVCFSLQSWSEALTEENLTEWTANYAFNNKSKSVAIIMAGNIPLVGFHDILSVLISGHKVVAKVSSNDKYIIPLVAKYLQYINPEFKELIEFTEGELKGFDAVIATGSDNTARYFDYYFGKHPNIIRKNRNSVAVLTGNESKEELEALGEDIFRYYGLGCRSVSKLFVPKDYNFDSFFKAIFKYSDVINYNKYQNNYDYNKAVYLMSLFKLQENGFLMLKEDANYGSPIATLFYEYYESINGLENKLENDTDKIQCVVSNSDIKNTVAFGQSQHPKLWDYADGIDTLAFLNNL
ncbi:acyl-CoA reductase [Urechidicola vernalis]|uniref:Acyl-CoA reductase n=1 Tax=Urechidicola vernalis TaxID=3075600 RepID=A0ABU2Y339_9FLAO|nr:acyl-CoA reductase [Urechidicola sp. P050]MDT0552059.1 acyl-CoA reductase [Urechidicola sp. P050]